MSAIQHGERYTVHEVHNFGGFFGGDTVTLTATQQTAPDDEQTLTIDEKAFVNVADRFTVAAGMLLELVFSGDRVDRAELLGAASHQELRAALGPYAAQDLLDGPLVLSYHCPTCNLWLASAPVEGSCRVCETRL